MEPWSKEWKEEQLFALHEQWKDCNACTLHEARQNVVFGYGNADARILLVGEAPGADEDEQAEPFVGESGKLLRALVEVSGLKWDELYVTNIVACRPPENRDPQTAERNACLTRVHQIIYM